MKFQNYLFLLFGAIPKIKPSKIIFRKDYGWLKFIDFRSNELKKME